MFEIKEGDKVACLSRESMDIGHVQEMDNFQALIKIEDTGETVLFRKDRLIKIIPVEEKINES